MRWTMALAAVLVMLDVDSAWAQNVAMGEEVFHRCAVCHEVGPEAVNRMGPVLNDLFGRQAGSLEGFPYTSALIELGQSGLVWTEETVAQFIAKPRHYEPGTSMIFAGLDNPYDIADVVAYLATFNGQTLPVRLGQSLVSAYCASCHAIGREGESPHEEAPPFRELHERYDVGDLSEALVEGLVSGHPDMPEFEFQPEQAEAIVQYLKSLE